MCLSKKKEKPHQKAMDVIKRRTEELYGTFAIFSLTVNIKIGSRCTPHATCDIITSTVIVRPSFVYEWYSAVRANNCLVAVIYVKEWPWLITSSVASAAILGNNM